MPREDFAREFERVLFNTLQRYDPTRREENRFDHYFAVALKMKTNDLIRHMLSSKNVERRKAIQINSVDIEDNYQQNEINAKELAEHICFNIKIPEERWLFIMRVAGHSIDEICAFLHINKREYWTKMQHIRSRAHFAMQTV